MYKNIYPVIDTSFEKVAYNRSTKKIKRLKPRSLVRSPLRYPGGKSRAMNTIVDLIPPNIDCLVSPFIGGASIELAVASKCGKQVYGYDVFKPLVTFWNVLLSNPSKLADAVKEHHPLTKTKFYSLQNRLPEMKAKHEIAAAFFALNRSSFSGTTLSGGMSPDHPRFTESAIERLAAFKVDSLTVEEADFKESLTRHKNDFLYLDPPYANGGALYGKKGDCHIDFDHKGLADILTNRDRWLLSYNDCTLVRDLYKNHKIITPEWTYGMSADKRSKEVIILSHDHDYVTRVS
ncbi:MAG: DNA adenine methylase [Ekhidna sp.]|nr:DNA adenine methylase [Ekhidna sp.]